MFAVGAWFFATHRRPRPGPRRHLAGPVRPGARATSPSGYQIAQSLFAQADGGLFGTGFGQAAARRCPTGETLILPAPQTDLIYAVIVNELGLVGACGLLLVYLLFVERGFKIAMLAQRLVLEAARRRPHRGASRCRCS